MSATPIPCFFLRRVQVEEPDATIDAPGSDGQRDRGNRTIPPTPPPRKKGRGHRDVVELFGHLAAVLERPFEELDGFGGGGLIRRILVHQDEGRGGNRPGF